LVHNSKAVHRAYAKRVLMKIPSLEDNERNATKDFKAKCEYHAKYITPFVVLRDVADFGDSNLTVRLAAPIVLFDGNQADDAKSN